MRALITGASSGLGRDLAIKLSKKGYELVLISRDKKALEKVKKDCKTEVTLYEADVSSAEACIKIHEKFKDIDLLINNAGFGLFGETCNTSLDKELNMIDLNVKAVHILTKLYLIDMIEKDSGRILNVASIAAFPPGPLMNTYYSTKSYVFKFTTAIYEELRRRGSSVKISVLCPGPFNTNFNNVAGVKFSLKGKSCDYVSSYAIKGLFKNKLVIIPGFITKVGYFLTKITPLKLLLKIDYNMQRKKDKK